ncbi:MAG: energy transducer TonB [Bacteroidota bacterium]
MKKPKKFIQVPQYPGGRDAMRKFITENLSYPKKAGENNIEGTVVVVIDINGDGIVERTRLKKKLGYGCDEEAQRVAKLLKFHPTKNRKVRVTSHRTINFSFRKPRKKIVKKVIPKPQTRSIQVVYNYVPKKKS